ncbi:MAG TPA: hypothetical protein VMA54_12900 [Steroidobacteraceae bacterium]|nr:hypothetical protein [Steroidobacteraceae bacterium]
MPEIHHIKLGSAMKLYGSEGVLLMEVESIKAGDRNIHIKGKMMGQVPMTVVMRPSDLREAVKMVSLSVIWQAIRMFFIRGDKQAG